MDYTEILTRAWQITWRHKWLWVLGLFAGGSYSSSSGSSWQESFDPSGASGTPSLGGLEWTLIALVGVVVIAIGLVFWVLGIAARAGLIAQVDRADGGVAPSLREGWRVGFRLFWRTFGMSVVLFGPLVLLFSAALAASFVPLIGPLLAGAEEPSFAAFGGFCGVLVLAVIVMIPLGIVLGILYELALRYAVLEDRRWSDAIKTGWGALRARPGSVAAVWAIGLGISIAMGAVVAVIAGIALLPFLLPAMSSLETGSDTGPLVLFAVVALLVSPVFLLLSAVFNTLRSAIWTVFWRRLHGKVADQEVAALHRTVAQAAYVAPPEYPAAEYPAQPAVPPAPPAPPAGPVGGP